MVAELDLDRAALRDLERPPHRVRVLGEVEGHLGRALEEELVGVELPAVRVVQARAGLDAEERLVRAEVPVVQVVDVTGRDERQPRSLGELLQLGVDPRLRVETRVLDLDVRRVLAEDLHEAVEVGGRVLRPVLLQRLRDPSRQAPREGDQAVRVALEQLPVDARLVVVALEVAGGSELDQVAVALARLRQEGQVRVALPLRGAVVGDVDLAADQRLDPVLTRLAVELDGPGK